MVAVPNGTYMIGGVKTDAQARTNINGLYACGEVAGSGLHGANRLASNSLLEGLVFGAIAGENAGRWIADHPDPIQPTDIVSPRITHSEPQTLDIQDFRNSLRSIMWRFVAIRRKADRMAEALDAMKYWGRYVLDKSFDRPIGWEAQNMLTVGWLITLAAAERTESRGVHYREDYPQTDDAHWRRHILQCRVIEE